MTRRPEGKALANREEELSYCGAEVHRHDPDRFLAALYATPAQRESLLTLYAFNLEIAKVRESVSEPMLGEIRLQWWREALEEAYAGTTRLVEVGGKRLEVTIPRGVDSGTRIRLTGRGGDGRDLIVVCRLRLHPVFTRKGADLERELTLSLEQALLGAEVPVGTLKGQVLLTIPAGSPSGRVFRLAGQGMPRFKAHGAGDLYVRTKIVLPTDLSEDARAAARHFLDLAARRGPS